MSRHHAAHAGDVTHTINEINSMERSEAEALFGIQFLPDGEIFDETYQRKFSTLGEWAEFNVEQDEMEFEEDFHGNNGKHADW